MKINDLLNNIKIIDISDLMEFLKDVFNSHIKIDYKKERLDFLLNKSDEYDIDEDCLKIELLTWYVRITRSEKDLIKLNNLLNNSYRNKYSLLCIKNIEQLESEFWNLKDIVYDSVLLSASNISLYNYNENELDYWISIRNKNKKLYSALLYCGNLVGHIGAIVLNKKEYMLLRNGILEETNLKTGIKDVKKIKYLYIPTIVIHENFRGIFALKKLLNSFKNILLQEIKETTVFLIANVYSNEGKKLAEKSNFKFITKHLDGGLIYELEFKIKN